MTFRDNFQKAMKLCVQTDDLLNMNLTEIDGGARLSSTHITTAHVI